jgi:dihydrofolate synthase/folylpolyglutamate synthase
MLESILTAAGHKTGVYTSPHIHRYNERIRVGCTEADDESIVEAFAAIDAVRKDISLSYFEFGTLAALHVFYATNVDIAILENGLGGRLDASNIIDAEVAVITSIDIDHTQWLGDTREQIAVEKAAIARAGKPVVCADLNPPESVQNYLAELGATYYQSGDEFKLQIHDDHWDWQGMGQHWLSLPFPALAGEHQIENAAGVIAVCRVLPEAFRPDRQTIEKSLRTISLPGRFERIMREDESQQYEVVFDVAHNPAGINALVETLRDHPVSGQTITLVGMMADKDVVQMLQALDVCTDEWILTSPQGERALPADELTAALADILPKVRMATFRQVSQAMNAAQKLAGNGDRLVVTGSFYTVAEARKNFT